MAVNLSNTQIEDLAAFYAAQSITYGKANPALVKSGQQLYRGGNEKKGISACIACHGPRGLGNPAAGIPALGGQHAQYTVAQLIAYKEGKRKTDLNSMMHDITKRLSKKEMEAVASYMAGLH